MTVRTPSVVGAAPLLAGAVVPLAWVGGAGAACPFRALTGLPCPLCGATRAFAYAGHLDGRWLQFGAVWVVVAVALVVLGLLRRPLPRGPLPVVAVALAAWAWALAHAATIAP